MVEMYSVISILAILLFIVEWIFPVFLAVIILVLPDLGYHDKALKALNLLERWLDLHGFGNNCKRL